MERVFTEDVSVDGKGVRFPAGSMKDYPKNTWRGIETSIGKPLSEFTIAVEEAAMRGVLGQQGKGKPRRKREQIEPRAQLME